MEGKYRVAELERIAVAEYCLGNPLAAHPGAVLAAEVPDHKSSVSAFDTGVMPRDGRIAYHNIIVECAANPGHRAGADREMLSARSEQAGSRSRGRRC
jgi:hypothetical protein